MGNSNLTSIMPGTSHIFLNKFRTKDYCSSQIVVFEVIFIKESYLTSKKPNNKKKYYKMKKEDTVN
jgi:hypothetical protein